MRLFLRRASQVLRHPSVWISNAVVIFGIVFVTEVAGLRACKFDLHSKTFQVATLESAKLTKAVSLFRDFASLAILDLLEDRARSEFESSHANDFAARIAPL